MKFHAKFYSESAKSLIDVKNRVNTADTHMHTRTQNKLEM